VSEQEKEKLSFLDSLNFTNKEYIEELRGSPTQKKFMKLLKQIDEDGECVEYKTKTAGSKLSKVFLKTKKIIINYRRKEQLWK